MDKFFLLVLILQLIYNSHSAPQFPANPDYPYYRAHTAPQFPSQGNFPGYYYYQHPFAYDPYSNPFYIYNHLGTAPVKPFDTKYKPEESNPPSESSEESKKVNTKSAPLPKFQPTSYIPVIQYVPAYYARNLDSWTAKEIPVTVIVDENFEKSYNVPYNTYQDAYVRNYVEQKPSSSVKSPTGSITVKSASEGQTINVRDTPIDQSQYIQGASLIPNVASINTPQASISFYSPHHAGLSYGGRDLGSWNVNEIPISAVVVDEGVDKNLQKETEKQEGKVEEKVSVSSA